MTDTGPPKPNLHGQQPARRPCGRRRRSCFSRFVHSWLLARGRASPGVQGEEEAARDRDGQTPLFYAGSFPRHQSAAKAEAGWQQAC